MMRFLPVSMTVLSCRPCSKQDKNIGCAQLHPQRRLVAGVMSIIATASADTSMMMTCGASCARSCLGAGYPNADLSTGKNPDG